jgi:hypothetical protein
LSESAKLRAFHCTCFMVRTPVFPWAASLTSEKGFFAAAVRLAVAPCCCPVLCPFPFLPLFCPFLCPFLPFPLLAAVLRALLFTLGGMIYF